MPTGIQPRRMANGGRCIGSGRKLPGNPTSLSRMSGDQAKGVKVEAKMDRACSHDSSRCCADGQTKDLMNQTLPPLGLPPKTVIDVWRVELDQPPEIAATLDEILSAEERERANRFVFARDAARFRLGRAMLRLGLAWYLEQPPRE